MGKCLRSDVQDSVTLRFRETGLLESIQVQDVRGDIRRRKGAHHLWTMTGS